MIIIVRQHPDRLTRNTILKCERNKQCILFCKSHKRYSSMICVLISIFIDLVSVADLFTALKLFTVPWCDIPQPNCNSPVCCRDAMDSMRQLHKHIQESMGKLARLADTRLHKLEQCLQLREFEEECGKVSSKSSFPFKAKHFPSCFLW